MQLGNAGQVIFKPHTTAKSLTALLSRHSHEGRGRRDEGLRNRRERET